MSCHLTCKRRLPSASTRIRAARMSISSSTRRASTTADGCSHRHAARGSGSRSGPKHIADTTILREPVDRALHTPHEPGATSRSRVKYPATYSPSDVAATMREATKSPALAGPVMVPTTKTVTTPDHRSKPWSRLMPARYRERLEAGPTAPPTPATPPFGSSSYAPRSTAAPRGRGRPSRSCAPPAGPAESTQGRPGHAGAGRIAERGLDPEEPRRYCRPQQGAPLVRGSRGPLAVQFLIVAADESTFSPRTVLPAITESDIVAVGSSPGPPSRSIRCTPGHAMNSTARRTPLLGRLARHGRR